MAFATASQPGQHIACSTPSISTWYEEFFGTGKLQWKQSCLLSPVIHYPTCLSLKTL